MGENNTMLVSTPAEANLAIVLAYVIDKYCQGQAHVGTDMEKFMRENPTIQRIDNEDMTFTYIVERKPNMGSSLFGRN